mgnify:CR=1 FL=1
MGGRTFEFTHYTSEKPTQAIYVTNTLNMAREACSSYFEGIYIWHEANSIGAILFYTARLIEVESCGGRTTYL